MLASAAWQLTACWLLVRRAFALNLFNEFAMATRCFFRREDDIKGFVKQIYLCMVYIWLQRCGKSMRGSFFSTRASMTMHIQRRGSQMRD